MAVGVCAAAINEKNSPRTANRRAAHTRTDAAILEFEGSCGGHQRTPKQCLSENRIALPVKPCLSRCLLKLIASSIFSSLLLLWHCLTGIKFRYACNYVLYMKRDYPLVLQGQ